MGALPRAGRRAWLARCALALAGIGAVSALAGAVSAQTAAPAPNASAPAPEFSERPRVAVLNFRVYSAREGPAIGDALAQDLRRRLESFGTLRVLDAASSAGVTESTAGGEAALRELAKQLGVDHIVTGALTELAGRYSLDVRVTAATAR